MSRYPSFLDLLQKKILTVSELTERVKEVIDLEFRGDFVWVAGEVSNFRDNYASGHWYFTLRDENSQVSAVCFKTANEHIKFLPENGMEVICCGEVSVYAKQGRYQIACYYLEPKGVGAEAMALEQLKSRLLAEGLFDEQRKRPLPFLPTTIGIVTSPSGAALRDILKVLQRRFPGIGVILSPARVQGREAPGEIVRALRRLYETEGVDLIILARGGGGQEDLWAFNEEAVAREIVRSPVPVISAVGHEIDLSVSDLVADLRAATPSMAAELAVREKGELDRQLDDLGGRMARALSQQLHSYSSALLQLESEMAAVMERRLGGLERELNALAAKMDALSPLKVLERGYSITQKLPSLKVVRDSKELKRGESLLVTLHRGKARCSVEETED